MPKTTNRDEHRGVWVFADQYQGKISRVTLELLGKGSEIAKKLEVEVSAVLLGHDVESVANELIAYGADRVVTVDHPKLESYKSELYSRIISDLVISKKPEILLVGATAVGRELAPRLSYRLNTGCTADCTELDVDTEKRELVMTRPAFGGNVMATILCPNHQPQMSTARPGVLPVPEKDETRQGKIEGVDVAVDEIEAQIEVHESMDCRSEGVDIREAERIVSIGLGAGDKETFDGLSELAEALDAGLAASRLAVEAGWISHDSQVGQTGKTVRPSLYVACGISGAIQHTAGMSDSKFIVAINSNPDAEIFEIADYGIVGDIKEIVPKIVEEISNAKS